MDVADLLHLETAFHTDRIIDSTSYKENIMCICLLGGKPLDSFFIINNSLHFLRKSFEIFNISCILLLCDLLPGLGKLDCK